MMRWVRAVGNPLVIALLCLPTLLAVGLMTSGALGPHALQVSLVAAFLASTIGGFVAAIVARAPGEIAGPTPSTTVIYVALATDLAHQSGSGHGLWEIWAAMSMAVMMMGALLLLAGALRLADLIKFLPAPVTAGLVTGVGVFVIWSQLAPAFGIQGKLPSLWDLGVAIKPGAAVVAVATVLALVAANRYAARRQPVLLAVIAGTAIYYLIGTFGPLPLGPRLPAPDLPSTALTTAGAIWHVFLRESPLATALHVLPYAGLLALQATMNAATTSLSVAQVVGKRSDGNRTLVAQGLANLIGGCLGTLPVSTSAALSAPAAALKGDAAALPTRAAIILLILALSAAPLLATLPVAVLAAILLMGGVSMVKQSTLRLVKAVWGAPHRNIQMLATPALAIVVAAAFVFGGVPVAVLTGGVLAMLLLTLELSAATRIVETSNLRAASRRVWAPAQAQWLQENASMIALVRPHGPLFFGTADRLEQQFQSARPGTRFCVLDLARVTTVDATACEIIARGARSLAANGITPLVAGVGADGDPRRGHLFALGLTSPDPRTHWFSDADHAVEHAEAEMLRKAWPNFEEATEFSLANTSLTTGLEDAGLQTLRGIMRSKEASPGPLFQRGDAGGSMFIVESGRVEIRVGPHGQQARLAAFAKGSVFGELSLLTGLARSADAICTTHCRLLELDRNALDRLEVDEPVLFAAIMRNISLHTAWRLQAATDLIRDLR